MSSMLKNLNNIRSLRAMAREFSVDVLEDMLKFDFPKGALRNILALTLPEVGPLTGSENAVPLVLYQLA